MAQNERTITLDLTNFRSERGDYIPPPGPYTVRVDHIEKRNSSRSGNDYLQAWLQVVDSDGPQAEHRGAVIIDRPPLSDAGLWRTVAFLQALQVPTPREKIKLPLDQLVGKRMRVEVQDGEFNNQKKTDVSEYLRLDEGPTPDYDGEGDLGLFLDDDAEASDNGDQPEVTADAEEAQNVQNTAEEAATEDDAPQKWDLDDLDNMTI